METIRCPDGHIIPVLQEPNPNKFYLIWDIVREKFAERVIEINEKGVDVELRIQELIIEFSIVVYKCPECGRLLISNKETGTFDTYIIENTVY